ncbi:helix-turn-helix domain-containing protein [Myroides odoratimimus]|uniref:helix-turn-helix domain-containing protein n=1 Tax=Myroides odoratimimus TaxID=76832 RepID=UPI00046A13C3|nr:helix-turn-helix domain-containing protein [Myroides odoratimimus]
MHYSIKVNTQQLEGALSPINKPYYFVILIDGEATFSLDFNRYSCSGQYILFLSPYQLLTWKKVEIKSMKTIQFHGDFYCIEYHKKEVACNGVLFNSLFEVPYVPIQPSLFLELTQLFDKIEQLEHHQSAYDIPILKTYLQLVLALSSKEKQLINKKQKTSGLFLEDIASFQEMLEEHFMESKAVVFYAEQYHLSVDVFSKKVRKYYGKTPSKLIQERLILEAKKHLHLTYKSVKEIAKLLGFEDEFYFSRYFKKEVGVSPKIFREQVGISVVAKKSME